jgi:hypothetical protein
MSDQITGSGGVNVEEPAPKEPYVSTNGGRRSSYRLMRRYIGLAAIAIAIVVIALALPSKSPKTVSGLAALGATGSSASSNGGVASSAKGASGGKIGSGTTVNGTKCAPGVTQFSTSVYAPPCMGAWTGNNGGATAHGVTAKTITLYYRYYKECATPTSYCSSELSLINSLVAYFNKQYETYGRQVVVKAFHGQGSVYAEADNQGQPQAQADAQTAYDLGAFAEATAFDYPPMYQALSNKGIITFGDLLPTIKTLQNYAPYVYSEVGWPLAENWGNAATEVACNRMKGMNAIYAGPAYQNDKRVFGLVISNDPDWGAAGSLIQHTAGQCGINIVNRETYSVNITGEAAEATPIIAQLKASGVTTVLCGADTLMTAILMEAAAKQHYFPEWLIWEPWIEDRTAPASEEAHTIKISSIGPDIAYADTETYKICQLAACNPRDLSNAETIGIGSSQGADGTLYNLMWIFDGIQMAGPNLTPANFFKGFSNLPCATGSIYGTFCYSASTGNNGTGSQPADFVISAWDPTVVNPMDHQKGNWVDCENGTRFKYPVGFGTVADLGSGSQLNCPSLPKPA